MPHATKKKKEKKNETKNKQSDEVFYEIKTKY